MYRATITDARLHIGAPVDVADHIVVMDAGHIEQQGSARELYEHPASEFVVSFVGPVNRLDDRYVRPHDLELHIEAAEDTTSAVVERVVYLGFEVRVELRRGDGVCFWAQLSRDTAERLELYRDQTVHTRSQRERVFAHA